MAAEVGLAAFSSIVSEVVKSFFTPIVRQTSYMFKYQSFVQDIKNQSEELGHKRQRVEEDVKQAERQGDKIYEDVQDWLKREEQFTGSVVKPIIEDESDTKKNCFKGVCPNLFKRYSLGRKAAKAKKEGDDLLGKGNFSKISYRPAPEASLMPVRGYEHFDSRRLIFQDVIEALKDPNVDMIGVYGMGGVGKTTLVKKVAGQVKENKLFDEVAMAEVTQTPDHKLIQDKIACDLGLQFEQGESVFQRANRLRARLKTEKRVLVILDNIWTGLELDNIGIPYGEDRRRCTIILTSRSRDLLYNDMNSQKNFFIEVLSKEEARQLFEKIMGDLAKQSDFQPIAEEIVGRCGGLPVAVNTIANALKNRSLHTWKDALGQLRNSNLREIHGMDANVYSSIELSYNFLESDEAKYLFLLCSLFRQSESINVSYLLRYGTGWGLFKGVDTLEAGWNRVHKLIDDLKAACLLLDGDAKDQVKLHDVIYDVAVSIAAEKLMFNIPNAVDLKKERIKILQKGATAISLPYRDQELPERLECPKLELFLLFEKRKSSMQIPDQFFEGMEELKVLHFTGICFPSLPSSYGFLINLQTLCLDGCQLEDMAIIGQLKNLEILSFQYSNIKQLSVEIGQLKHLRLLDLSNCLRLKVIAPNVISKLSQLEELYMCNSFTQWEKIEGGSNNASVAELKGLSKLTTLDICIEDAQVVQQDLGFEKLEWYRILIGVVERWYSKYEISRLMKLRGLEKSILLGHGMKMLLKKTENLHIKELKGFQNVVHELDDGEGFPRLKHFHVENCNEILHIVSSMGQVHGKVFPLLESSSLCKLINLEKVCHGQLAEDQSFINLTKVTVERCHRLKYMFSYSMVNILVRLQHLMIYDCDSMEGVVDTTGLGRDDEKVVFTKLHYMQLSRLQKLTSFAIAIGIHSSGIQPQPFFDEKVQLPNLETLTIAEMKKLREIWHHQQATDSFSKLNKLEIYGCDGLINIFPSMARHSNSEVLSISSLKNGRELWHDQQDANSFNKLKDLRIDYCDSLMNIFPPMARHSNLEVLSINSAKNLKEIWHDQQDADSFSKLKDFSIKSCDALINIYPPMARHSNLEVLSINSAKNLREIWHDQQDADSFSKLKDLSIKYCDALINIFPPMARHSNLEVLSINSAKNLREIWHDQQDADSFSKLKDFSINSCDALINIFPPMTRHSNLEGLSITGMTNLREIWHDQQDADSFSKLKDLSIYYCDSLMNIFPPMVRLPHLKELSIARCNKLKNIFPSNMIMGRIRERLEVLNVRRCESIEEIIEETSSSHKDFIMEVGEVRKDPIVFSQLKHLRLEYLPSLQSFCLGNYTLEFPSLEDVAIIHCTHMKTFSPAVLCTPKLNKVRLCVYVEDSWEWEGNLNSTVQKIFKEMYGFKGIRSLKLSQFPHLKEIWHSQALPVSCFRELMYLVVDDCMFFSSAIPANLTPLLNNLRFLEVRDCDSVEEVFHLEEPNADEHFGPLLLNLTRLELYKLPKLLHLWKANSQLNKDFQSLETLEISECNKLEKLVLSLESFKNLTTLKVSKCDGLTSFVTVSTVKSLTSLRIMIIADCKKIEEILEHGREEVEGCMVFCSLRYLQLNCLPSLTGFCLGNYNLEFPSLKKVVLRECPKMKTFSNGVLSTPKLYKVQVMEKDEEIDDDDGREYMFEDEDKGGEDEGRWEGNLNSMIQQLFKEMNV